MKKPSVPPKVKTLAGCLGGSLVLAIMFGPQEGSQTDYGYELRQSLLHPRVFAFLTLGAVTFLLLTFQTRIRRYLGRPGVAPLGVGAAGVVVGQTLMRWYDPIGNGKFAAVRAALTGASAASPVTTAFFDWLAWTQLIVIVIGGAAAVVTGVRKLAWFTGIISVGAAVDTCYAHQDVVNVGGGVDHSLGYGMVAVAYITTAAASFIIARSRREHADTRGFANRVLGWRPGLAGVAGGTIVGVLAMTISVWYSPEQRNTRLTGMSTVFDGTGVGPVAEQYLQWLGWTFLAAAAATTALGAHMRSRLASWVGAALGLTGSLTTLYTMYRFSETGAILDPTSGSTWQNLGSGGWMACAGLFVIAGSGYVAATARDSAARNSDISVTGSSERAPDATFFNAPGAARTLLVVAAAFALFYPPTATDFWQSTLVSQIGIYVLLAVGLNVVVGWAGLLDLGFIAFYAIGSYMTAYLTGVLPIKPPSWLIMSPLLAIPFAVIACLIAGVLLGAPTLRLRGDYLAIVTLGFGEIIRLIANNADSITNGSRGTAVDPSHRVNNVPHPTIHIGPVHITWGANQLQYWYLLLVLIVLVLIVFRRLENSRTGRAWAAIREDEVAAQATGINTFRYKLLAFAIGASTSGIAGVFFASQVGFVTPDNFVLNNSILVVAYVVFGGMGSLPGAVIGAAVLTWLPQFLRDQVPNADQQMWIGAVVLLMMIFRPAGLLPAKRRRTELQPESAGYATSNRTAVPATNAADATP